MIKDNNKNQQGGDSSSNIQAENVNVYNGISYRDAKEIALDVFKSNFLHLKDEAAQIAAQRAEEITEKILDSLKEKSPDALDEFQQPGMQDSLFTAQKEYAKSGDKDLGDLLADIVVDRANVSKRNMLQIVLDESLTIASKLTVEQLDTLTLIFLLTRTVRRSLGNYEDFKKYLQFSIFPFVENLFDDQQQYNYLEYLRCGQIRAGNFGQLENNLRTTYKGFFSKGFTQEDYSEHFKDHLQNFSGLVIPCFHNKKLQQIGMFDDDVLAEKMEENAISDEQKNKIKAFFERTTLSSQEIKEMLEQFDPKLEKVFRIWQNSAFNKFELSHVGIAIAHANYRRRTGETMDLSIWIK
ncbi:LPO_1073/Vpar_1526 family protein [Salinimicrobium sp. WS361]|uniref:LPO_1073/Vpar_1526 family protein n=1 Tax=Salinimicrobium sp. WS361 TaxID=3425123 RepID=UPI003D6FE7DC